MSQYTENYHLEKPESNDDFENFRENYNSNMDIIDQHLGGGGGGSDVSWSQLQVTGDKIATIRISGIDTDVYSPNARTFSMAVSRANIDSGEDYSTIFGKIKKYFADLKAVAFSGNSSDLNNDAGFVSDVKVNDTSVVNSSHVANITSYEEVTIAQYNALPASKKNCGIAYFIKDLDNASVEGYPPLIYSLEEREVGVFVDGKPLYQKTVVLNNLSVTNNQWARTNESATGIETIVNGFLIDNQSPSQTFQCDIGVDSGNIVVLTWFVGNSSRTMSYLTFRYTKTTDTAGSGIWNGQGGLAHHYSTSEKIIGTWIDGKPLYEITLQGTTSNTNVSQILDIVANNINMIISCEGKVGWKNSDGDTATRNLNGYVDSNTYGDWGTNSANTYLIIMYGNYMKNQNYILTVRYTKTTD